MNANINGQPKIGSSNIRNGEALDNITNNATKPSWHNHKRIEYWPK